jgi:hypothetical protein
MNKCTDGLDGLTGVYYVKDLALSQQTVSATKLRFQKLSSLLVTINLKPWWEGPVHRAPVKLPSVERNEKDE